MFIVEHISTQFGLPDIVISLLYDSLLLSHAVLALEELEIHKHTITRLSF
jgi:hypothetical protein